MADRMKVMVGGSLKDDLAAFRVAWERAERGQPVAPERVLAFESWEGLSRVLTGERYKLLRHLRAHPEPSVSALAVTWGVIFDVSRPIFGRWRMLGSWTVRQAWCVPRRTD